MSGINVHDLSILIVAGRLGHITNRASAEEFERVHEFLSKLMETFALCAAHCIVVPSNYTV